MGIWMAHPWKHPDSGIYYLRERIPVDVLQRARGRSIDFPQDAGGGHVTVGPRSGHVKVSLRTRERRDAIARYNAAAAHLARVWAAMRQNKPAALTHKQATALAGELYLAWAGEDDRAEQSITVEHIGGGEFRRVDDPLPPDVNAAAYRLVIGRLEDAEGRGALEASVGPIVDRLLLSKGIGQVDSATRLMLLEAFGLALQDAFAKRERNAEGDYSPDPKSERFPAWRPPEGAAGEPRDTIREELSLTAVVEHWWREAQATGRSVSTYGSYRSTFHRLATFLGHDDPLRVTRSDVLAFKDQRLAQGVSAKTVRDSDLVSLKSVFGWAVANLRMPTNPADGVTVRRAKVVMTRGKGFTPAEAAAVLRHSLNCKPSRASDRTYGAKRWVPWLCAYTGARVGEIVQLRKEDVRREDESWLIAITPEAGPVKTKQAREVPLHRHLVELGFLQFVDRAPFGYLFIFSPEGTDFPRGRWQAVKNRVAEFVREVVADRSVAPNHAWRHTFKTIGRGAGIQDTVLDAICGHAPRTEGDAYGSVTLQAKVKALRRFPKFNIGAGP